MDNRTLKRPSIVVANEMCVDVMRSDSYSSAVEKTRKYVPAFRYKLTTPRDMARALKTLHKDLDEKMLYERACALLIV